MDKSFVRADGSNLPKIDALMVGLFFKNNPDFYSAELRNVKTTLASRESYGDDAIGWVQLCRKKEVCTVKCQMCPEHKVRSASYKVTLVVNEKKRQIISCECHDCVASLGGCKHAVAFLMWVHRRSEEPSCTSVECYWKKSTLSRVGTSLKFIAADQLCKKKAKKHDVNSGLFLEFVQEAKKRKLSNCEVLKYQNDFVYVGIKQFSFHSF
ncbi:hypothetical protein ABEB36_015516 [Hypothenemus hampei]|uniref:SWIM-type domain-containing protein n=1 Tax=Hypothenemus hampei TaxID=57062 RepID=A0ABD1DZN1_HYPHA